MVGAADAFDGRDFARALSCAEDALRVTPRLVAALHYRAASLASLGRFEEARTGYARALAVDPDDPETLLGAAELFVSHLNGDREALEVGLEYAVRGARQALRPARRDRDLAGRLYTLAGMAENDLGRSQRALSHLDLALGHRPDDLDARFERGVALYELCRFPEAKRAFERVLDASPNDPWALHHLGLVAEREGDGKRAEQLFKRALDIAPGEFKPPVPIPPEAFDEEVRRAVAALPEHERRALREVPVQVEDLPSLDDLTAVQPPLSPSILGLFRGPSEREPCDLADGPQCRAIVFYRKNLLRFARDRKELAEQVRVTLLHELGHLHGENDDDLRQRGLE
jgi:tetratricopeptide (TPR) repeat protein